jgi:hypothetical protein
LHKATAVERVTAFGHTRVGSGNNGFHTDGAVGHFSKN